jgi:leucyl/phenylalanyl-tRNA--protein transferase
MPPKLTPELIVRAYCQGAFPMAETRHGPVAWYSPDPRAILPLDGFHIPQSLARRVRSGRFSVTFDRAFERVILACAEPREQQRETWINEPIIQAYTQLHAMGIGHSVEAWLPAAEAGSEARLVGGLYGLALGAAFFGESMFSIASDASKVCLVHLVERLRTSGFTLLDTQMSNPHMEQFGVIEIPRDDYLRLLDAALQQSAIW